jgi:osmotically inducible lipoprotein OsmB
MLSISRPMWVTKGRAVLLAGVLLATGLGTTACTENTGKGAAIGAAAGAGLGVLNGGIIRNTATGAALGAAGGYIYDRVRD